nr:hypothetical protein [Tanacetum cinerariifolium]
MKGNHKCTENHAIPNVAYTSTGPEKISSSDKLDLNITSITAGAVRGSFGNIIHPNNSSKRTRTPTQLSPLSKQTAALVGSDCDNIYLTPQPKIRPRFTDFSTHADVVVGTVINRIPTNINNSKRTRTPTQVSPLSKGNDIFVTESTRIKSTHRPRGRLRLTDLSTLTDKQTFNKTTAKGKSIRQKHESRFISQTPVTFDLESPSTKQVRLSSHQSSLLTSDRRQELKCKMAMRQFSCSDYIDHGDPTFECSSCGALLWYERVCEEQPIYVPTHTHCVVVEVSNGESSSFRNNELDYQLTTDIRDLLDEINPLVQDFRMAGERIRSSDDEKISLRLIVTRQRDGRQYNLPTASEVAALIVGDFNSTEQKRDIILHCQDEDFKRISELHPSYLALHYPLFFPYDEDNYHSDIFHEGVTDYDEKNKGTRVTMKQYFAYRIQERKNEFSMMLNGRRLFQQFIVDAYTMIESKRLTFNRKNDKDLRSETYSKLATLVYNSESGVKLRGKKVILNSNFTGSPRYMMQNYLDAMNLCKFYGYPELFITFTCNPNWPEITRFMKKRGLKSEDRPDVRSRVFKIKLDCLMKELNDGNIFGRVKGVVYTIEFQKRGLPHCHILLWLETKDNITTTGKIDEYISAKIPNKDEDPELYQLVTDHMMHGPCGADNPSCPCTIEYKCTKKFPRQFNETTVIDDSGYALYKKRNDGSIIKKSRTDLHNGYVVPYNPRLLRRYQAHINVEWCNQVGSIKYLFKYINKGPDRVSATIDGEEVDEIKDFLNCIYLSACEAAWRIYGFEIHYRTPSVEWFPFHLKDEQQVIFDATKSIDYAVDKSSVNETKFE